ncbi:MAG TPA: glycosyltransferase family 39 protein [Dehalococcoidia bacterium]|nr:glycosyltransferase family 39 protein [Dehalococcoidia bacterium]
MIAQPPSERTAPRSLLARAVAATTRPHVLALLAIIVLAIGLRLAWIAYVNPDPLDGRLDDTVFYVRAGQSLADGVGYTGLLGAPTAQWPPAYPFLLAGIYKAFGHNIIIPKVVNALAGGLTCLLIYLIAARVFSRRVGLLGAFLFAVFPGQLFWSTLLMTESLTPALLCLMLLLFIMWVVERRDAGVLRYAILGAIFGVALLARGEGAALLLAALVAWRLVAPSWRQFGREAGLFTAAAVLVVIPWTVRNAISMHAFVPVSSALGHTLLAGHQEDPYNPYHVFPEAKIQEEYSYLPFPEREIKVENVALRQSISFAVHHPLEEAYFPFVKFYHLFRSDADAIGWINGWFTDGRLLAFSQQAKDMWSELANGYYRMVMLWAGLGIPLWFSIRDPKKLLLMLFVGAWVAVHVMLWPSGRYHAALTPIFALWAAVPLIAVYDTLVTRRSRAVAATASSRATSGR